MGATEEQMLLVADSGIDHVAYVLILFSLAFVLFLFVHILIHIYDRAVNKPAAAKLLHRPEAGRAGRERLDPEEFELDGLASDDDDDDDEAVDEAHKLLGKDVPATAEDGGLASPSTVGKNSDVLA